MTTARPLSTVLLLLAAAGCGDPGSNQPGDPGSNQPGDPGSNQPGDPGSNQPGDPYATHNCIADDYSNFQPTSFLTIIIRNETSETRYVQVTPSLVAPPPGYVQYNVPSCHDLLINEDACMQHIGGWPAVAVLAPGAEHQKFWLAAVVEKHRLGAECGLSQACDCYHVVEPPPGRLWVGFRQSTTTVGTTCDPKGTSCEDYGSIEGGTTVFETVYWPKETEVVLAIQ